MNGGSIGSLWHPLAIGMAESTQEDERKQLCTKLGGDKRANKRQRSSGRANGQYVHGSAASCTIGGATEVDGEGSGRGILCGQREVLGRAGDVREEESVGVGEDAEAVGVQMEEDGGRGAGVLA